MLLYCTPTKLQHGLPGENEKQTKQRRATRADAKKEESIIHKHMIQAFRHKQKGVKGEIIKKGDEK
jgi:hypothetical protein